MRRATSEAVANFIMDNIISKTEFKAKGKFMNLLLKSESTTYYPAGNGQAEAMNKILLQIRKLTKVRSEERSG